MRNLTGDGDDRAAAFRRRRAARVGGVLVFAAVLAGLMIYVTQQRNSEPDDQRATSSAIPPETPCPGVQAPPSNPEQYGAPEDVPLEDGIDYRAVVKTSCGDIEIDLLEAEAPQTVANFIFLAGEGFYDGLTWHRVDRNFVIQTGDPDGQATVEPNGPGYTIDDEVENTERSDYIYGAVGMANTGVPNSGGSQWFVIVHDPDKKEHAGLDPLYTIFGKVSRNSYEVIEEISKQPVEGGDDPAVASRPVVPVYVLSVEIIED
jgi:cyclophilin family peptidyl-prolyl cis-trans isomerase